MSNYFERLFLVNCASCHCAVQLSGDNDYIFAFAFVYPYLCFYVAMFSDTIVVNKG